MSILEAAYQDLRIRLTAADDLLALVNEELAEMQETVDRMPGGGQR